MSNSSISYNEFTTGTEFEYSASAEDMWKWIVYTIQGAIIMGTNIPILVIFFKYSAFNQRKEYVFVAGLCFADAFNGLGYCSAGIWRSAMVVTGRFNDRVTAYECLWTVHNLTWLFSDSIAALMLLVISIDRFFSVVLLKRYIHWGRSYALAMAGAAYLYVFSYGLIGVYVAVTKPRLQIYPRTCYTSHLTKGSVWQSYQYLTVTLATFASVLIYMMIAMVGRRHYQKALQGVDPRQTSYIRNIQAQRRMTASLAISSLLTFVLVCVPYSVNTFLLPYMDALTNARFISALMWMVSNVNPMLNIAIYVVRHWEVRRALRALTKCQQMPDNIQLVSVTSRSRRAV